MNIFLLVMVVLDVLCVLVELLIQGTKCGYKADDKLTDGKCFCDSDKVTCQYARGDEPFFCDAGDGDKKYGLSTNQYYLYYYIGLTSKSLLIMFAAQIGCLILCYGYVFFMNKYYVSFELFLLQTSEVKRSWDVFSPIGA